MKSEIKENVRRTNSDRKETVTKSTVWNRRKKETFLQNTVKKQEFKKKRGFGNYGTTLNIQTSES